MKMLKTTKIVLIICTQNPNQWQLLLAGLKYPLQPNTYQIPPYAPKDTNEEPRGERRHGHRNKHVDQYQGQHNREIWNDK